MTMVENNNIKISLLLFYRFSVFIPVGGELNCKIFLLLRKLVLLINRKVVHVENALL